MCCEDEGHKVGQGVKLSNIIAQRNGWHGMEHDGFEAWQIFEFHVRN